MLDEKAVTESLSSIDTQEQATLAEKQRLLDVAPARLQEHDTQMHAAEGALQSTLGTPVPQRPDVALPKLPDLKQLVDPKEFEGLSFALLGMALVGGAASHGNWLGVSASLNGALKGYHEGNQFKAKQELDNYDRQFKAAKEKEANVNKQFDDILKNRNITINEQLERIRMLAAQHGREDTLAEAKAKRLDGVINQHEARKAQLFAVQERHDAVRSRINATLEKHRVGAGDAEMRTDAIDTAMQSYVLSGGVHSPPAYSGLLVPMLAEVKKMAAAEGMTTQELLAGGQDFRSRILAKRSFEIRAQNMERAENQILAEIPIMQKAMGELHSPRLPIAARGNLAILRAMGSPVATRMDQSAEVVINEFEQIVTNSAGALHVQDVQNARDTYEKIQTPQQMKAWIDNAERIVNQAKKSVQTTREEVMRGAKAALHGPGGSAPAGDRPPSGASPTEILEFYTKKDRVIEFKTKAAADEAGAAGLLKPGQKITIKGKGATWNP